MCVVGMAMTHGDFQADPEGGLDGAHPGIKFWTYGVGKDQRWSNASTLSKECYLEIQAGPIADQSIKAELQPGETLTFQVRCACVIVMSHSDESY